MNNKKERLRVSQSLKHHSHQNLKRVHQRVNNHLLVKIVILLVLDIKRKKDRQSNKKKIPINKEKMIKFKITEEEVIMAFKEEMIK